MKIDEMEDVFLNLANFAQQTFFAWMPPSSYTWNLNTLTKVSNVSWSSQLSYKVLWSSLKETSEKTNFISRKKHLQKAQLI